MTLDDFDFELPAEQIAQTPLARRDGSRLMVVARTGSEIAHAQFARLPELLHPGDLLVVNDTRVVPARLLGHKVGTGGRCELLVVRPAAGRWAEKLSAAPEEAVWLCLGQASKGLKPGAELALEGGLSARIEEAMGEGEYRVRFSGPKGSFAEALEASGRIPLPPYIRRAPKLEDRARYQTVYARAPGSVAAPTAGLHFTEDLLARLEGRGVQRVALTLEVGPGTFLPVREQEIDRHPMHSERYRIPAQVISAIAKTRERGGRVIACGTTVVRALEAASAEDGTLREGEGETALFIRPGFTFRQVDAMITNFHLPKSTLLMLVCAFGGMKMLEAYRAAVARGYRFFSYGDAMLIADPPASARGVA